MNLRKTITGAAIALGGATVMLGLGGTANAAVDANTTPNLNDLELGKVTSVSDLASIDTDNPHGKVEIVNFDTVESDAHATNVDGDPTAVLLGYDSTEGPSSAGLGIG